MFLENNASIICTGGSKIEMDILQPRKKHHFLPRYPASNNLGLHVINYLLFLCPFDRVYLPVNLVEEIFAVS